MKTLPILLDDEEAIRYYQETESISDAEKAYVVRLLSLEGYQNKRIRDVLGIEKVYAVTHLKRAGLALSDDELTLWLNNPKKITLGHVRAAAKLPQPKRETLLRDILAKKISVHECELIAKGQSEEKDVDVKRYAEDMENQLGRPINIRYNPAKCSGSVTLQFFGLDDLDDVSESLGYKVQE
ncbi:transcriptional regulator [Candidatus Endobugula sertula]|uniref:Transcriptional regulator n=1 Tax=Candidatus Endobugula sertula TaxID=62101 RepID=A0A1D2QPU7_9GAMM|nr:transcriptional regulator [Candidatus Endobugula sertula]